MVRLQKNTLTEALNPSPKPETLNPKAPDPTEAVRIRPAQGGHQLAAPVQHEARSGFGVWGLGSLSGSYKSSIWGAAQS